VSKVDVLTTELPCLQELPPTEPADQGDEGEWDTVGEAAGSRTPAPTVEELLGQMERQPPAAQEGAEPAAAAVLTVKIRQPSHEFTFGVVISFIPYPLVLTPVV
jgi:hypothetical protein